MNQVLARNIRTLLEKRRAEESKASVEQKMADSITRFTGSMPFVYLHAPFFGFWIVINLGWLAGCGLRPFDPTVVLAMIASVEAIFLSTFILIFQNRMNAMSERRADLDLHISLLAEHEITKILQLASQLAEQVGVLETNSPELAELKRDMAPEKVLDKIQERSSQSRETPAYSRLLFICSTRKNENTLVCLHQWFVSAVRLTLLRFPFFENCAHPRDLSVGTGFRCQNVSTSAILAHRDGWTLTLGFFGRITRLESWRCAGDHDLPIG
jgi:uncharacterized membrane protein